MPGHRKIIPREGNWLGVTPTVNLGESTPSKNFGAVADAACRPGLSCNALSLSTLHINNPNTQVQKLS
jgi:hypothetical protein